MLLIEIGPKFTQAQFDDFLANGYWDKSFDKLTQQVTFDLTVTEWIASEQICFLFAWIRNLKLLKRKVIVRLPHRDRLMTLYSLQKLKQLEEKYKSPTTGELFSDNHDRVYRRSRSAAFLMVVYGMFTQLELEEVDFEQMAQSGTYNKDVEHLRKNNHQIIEFTPFELRQPDKAMKYDTHFFELISDNTELGVKTKGLFELQTSVQQLLKRYGCYSPFESKILSNVITQELFTNSLQHSFEINQKQFFPECYITAFLANKHDGQITQDFHQRFIEEKYPETQDFFKDKERICHLINKSIKSSTNIQQIERPADLKAFRSHFKNQSYLEYSFLDFGDGISATLDFELQKEIDNKSLPIGLLSPSFNSALRESQSIEYAFLIDSSKNPLDKRIDYFDLVPRGLYFLIDMIRRYKGLLIVRSGKGKVIYDFSDKIVIKKNEIGFYASLESKFTIAESVKHESQREPHPFPGTLFTIVLPAIGGEGDVVNGQNQLTDHKIGPIRTDDPALSKYAYSVRNSDYNFKDYPVNHFKTNAFHYISVLILYNAVLEKIKYSQAETDVKDIYNKLLIAINEAIDEAKGANCIIFFDFAGLRSGNALWLKILYYLMNTPKINEKTKTIIFNLPSDEQKIVNRIKENLSGIDKQAGKAKQINPYEPFLYKPIPCISYRFDLQNDAERIDWIGLKSTADEQLLTSLLLGKKETYNVSKFSSPAGALGNLFVHHEGWIQATFSGLAKLNELFLEGQRAATLKFLRSHIINGAQTEVTGSITQTVQQTVFLNASGGYQLQYLTLYESLHDKYIARYFAKCLLDKYAAYVQGQFRSQNQTGRFEDIEQFSFTKIIAVTVSSQLIGIAIRDLIIEDDGYTFLRAKNSGGGLDEAPELIMLSSYYSFETEQPFEKISKKDRLLIVNDVISTGRLVGKLIRKIEDEKRSRVNAVFSVSDTRIPHSERKFENEEECEFFGDYEDRFISLATFDEGIEIRKYKGPYSGSAVRKRVNPILNTFVELKATHGEQQKVLFQDFPKLLDEMQIDANYMKIGHFQQNMTHNGYLTNMRLLFSDQKGAELLEKAKGEIEGKGFFTAGGSPRRYAIKQIKILGEQLNKLSKSFKDDRYKNKVNALEEDMASFEKLLLAEESSTVGRHSYEPDFIFYPVFSGIERTNYLKLSEIFGTHPDNIIALQRFDTHKGWRFPFPAKRYNELTRNKSILILDAGSLTGESLVQLIDNIGFLDVKEILVLSVISRVEDFYREFYSRLRSINVKKLKFKDGQGNAHQLQSTNTVPIEIFFGVSLHIPVYASTAACPFCDELRFLDSISDNTHFAKQTQIVKDYIKYRKAELRPLNNSHDTLENISYLPVSRGSGQADTKGLFATRDFLGKIDSYRFYPEYFSDLNDLQEKIVKDENWLEKEEIKVVIERILICILHEPNLLELIDNYGSGLNNQLKQYIRTYVFSTPHRIEQLHYRWLKYALLHLSYILLKDEILTIPYFLQILSWDDNHCHLLMHFKLWDTLHGKRTTQKDKDAIEALLKEYTDQCSQINVSGPVYAAKNKEYSRILIRDYQGADLRGYNKLDLPFYNLSKFVYQGQVQDRHFVLKSNLNLIIDAILSIKPSLEEIIKKIEDTLYIFDQDLRPSVQRIVDDPAIRENCKTLYGTLSDQPKGLLWYINRLEEAEKDIGKLNQEELTQETPELIKTKDLCGEMVDDILKNKDDKDCFYRLCKEYPWSLKNALTSIQSKQSASTKLSVIPDSSKDILIAIHRDVIESMLEELVKNSKRHSNTPVEITFYYEETDQEYVKLTVTQNQPFRSPDEQHMGKGLREIVEHFAVAFGGSCNDNRLISMATNCDFEISIYFKIHTYANKEAQPDYLGQNR